MMDYYDEFTDQYDISSAGEQGVTHCTNCGKAFDPLDDVRVYEGECLCESCIDEECEEWVKDRAADAVAQAEYNADLRSWRYARGFC